MTQFTPYQHIERFPSEETDGITQGEVHIYPKLDGTNSSIWVENDNGEYVLCAGSRNRKLSLDYDNQGFYKYALTQSKYKEYLVQHPEYIIYGEFLVPHTIKDYDIKAWNQFYVFDVYDTENHRWIPYNEYMMELKDYGFNIIPPLAVVTNPELTPEEISKYLESNHYLLVSDKILGEGIVIKNYAYQNRYGRQTWGKVVMPSFKDNSRAKFKGGAPKTIEDEIIGKYLTEGAVHHEVLKFIDEYGRINGPNYKKMLGLVWYGWMQDHWWDIIRMAGKTPINFSTLRHKVENIIKLYYPI